MAEEKTAVIKEAKPYYALEDRFPLVETSLLACSTCWPSSGLFMN